MENKTTEEINLNSIEAEKGEKKKKSARDKVRFITRVSLFTALSTIFVSWFKFPLPFLPPFLKINFSNLFIILGSLLTGPIGGTIIVVLRFPLKLLLSGSTSGYAGDLVDLLLSLLIMLPGSILYHYKHTKTGGFFAILISFISWIISSLFINYFISIPLYVSLFFKGDTSSFIGMLSGTIKSVNENNFKVAYTFYAALPFNAIAGVFNAGIALVVYKKISTILKKIGL